MSDSTTSLSRKIGAAGDLQSVVRTMKAMAASSIGQYENAVRSLDDYYRTVQLGLSVCFRCHEPAATPSAQQRVGAGVGAVVFGSDQGLVGQFNDVIVDFVANTLKELPGIKRVWTVGELVESRLVDRGLVLGSRFVLPKSISAITSLVGQVLVEMEMLREKGEITQVYVFH